MYINLKILSVNPNEKSGIAKLQIPVKATIIIKIGLTILAETAASPSIRAPIIPTVVLKEEEILRPASLINSKDISIRIISNITGNGIASLELEIAKSNSEGISS